MKWESNIIIIFVENEDAFVILLICHNLQRFINLSFCVKYKLYNLNLLLIYQILICIENARYYQTIAKLLKNDDNFKTIK